MPGRYVHQDPSGLERTCVRCQVFQASIVVRAEPLCKDCFVKYINTKVTKRMESFRVRHSTTGTPRTLLLPISLGVSSVTLLHILDGYLQTQQKRTGRTGFSLHIVFTNRSAVEDADLSKLNALKARYPRHTYSTVELCEILNDDTILDAVWPGSTGKKSNEASSKAGNEAQARLEKVLASSPSASSQSDILVVLRTRLIVKVAQQYACEGILWGDTTTRLAERTLAETAKGRGFSLPWQVSDGQSPHGIPFQYPMRDLLKKELLQYAELLSPSLTDCIISSPTLSNVSASAKDTTIDMLMQRYIESVETNYPSIVANVVRTTSKLDSSFPEERSSQCSLCAMPVAENKFGLHGWGGDQVDPAVLGDVSPILSETLCYGCSRSTLTVTRDKK